jgi:cysteine desulfurase
MTLYLDNNATTPVDPRVQEEIVRYFAVEYGNAGSPHEFGERAKEAVHAARDQVGEVVAARRHEVIFTSGATESNNLAILGLAPHGRKTKRRHIVSTRIEHKAVLEPLDALRKQGFDVTLVSPDAGGRVAAEDVLAAVRPDTLLVSVMHVNNETGVAQPIAEVAAGLAGRDVLLHVDAAQGFGKQIEPLRHPRIDLISVSGHKIFGPKGVGALVARRRNGELPPLSPLMYGGGQELGLRPGTLPVALIAGLGKAASLALQEHAARERHCAALRGRVLAALAPLGAKVHGKLEHALPHVVNVSLAGLDAELVIESLRGTAAVSDGAACTSICATASHVLSAMGVSEPELSGAVRLSWSYLTDAAALDSALHVAVRVLSGARAISRQV